MKKLLEVCDCWSFLEFAADIGAEDVQSCQDFIFGAESTDVLLQKAEFGWQLIELIFFDHVVALFSELFELP